MIQREVQEIFKKLAIKYNKPVQVIEEIFLSQWKFLKEKISKPEDIIEFKTVKFPKWGKYYLSENKLKHIKRHNPSGLKKYESRRKKEDESSDQVDS